MVTALNPVVRGFAPDPSLIRVGEWFYLATSSFEWYPTIPIRRSRDLVEWEHVGSVDGAVPQGNLHGVPDSAGIWAPSLSHDGEQFWITYSIIRTFLGRQLDVETYISTSAAAEGPWRPPSRVSGHGFDPSIFHFGGSHYLLNLQCDSRPGGSRFSGILIVPLDDDGTRTVGTPKLLLQHPTLIEGPKLFTHDGWFHLVLAQGGTGVEHGVLMARSRELFGPYEIDDRPLLTSRDDRTLRLQKAGHGEFVQDAGGTWYLGHLASRWLDTLQGRQFPWGRETCVQEVDWVDGWPRLASGSPHPADTFTPPEPLGPRFPSAPQESPTGWPWRTPREPVGDWAVWADGELRLRGRHDLESLFGVSMLAQPVQEPHLRLHTTVDAEPATYTEGAGIVLWYDSASYYSLAVSWVEPEGETQQGQQWDAGGRRAAVLTARDLGGARVVAVRILPDHGPVGLAVAVDGPTARFRVDGAELGPALDVGILSDDYGNALRFTGSMVGVYAVDTVDAAFTAAFRSLEVTQSPGESVP
ncbi:MAG TPA: family 43 glycosylhydrolase [Microbacterium sp.]|uniref:family 43 glycosylhydrolase n=1 Tax=Microbacterium sp. TaxID=51671 RepID=UPI002B4AA205|nr:family 43 glycosylhydrolase [Microbacterium sp.]HKT57114.1 family 43 glycosylhydrolase [Microbacterium sp.]